MSLSINTNIPALNAQRSLDRSQNSLARAVLRLSTGLRINGASDDAAGLAISDRLTAQIRGFNQAVRNANDGASALQTADGALQEVANLLQRARELSVQSANDSNSVSDRQSLNAEVSNILAELDRLASTVQFNSSKLLDGTFSGRQFQIGANANQTVSFSISSVETSDLGAKILRGAAVSSTSLAGLTSTSSITINGTAVAVGAQTTIDGVITAVNNQTGSTNARAVKNTQTIVTDTGFIALTTAAAVQTLTLNGVTISLTTGNAADASSLAATINGFTNQTGVVVTTTAATSIIYTRASGGDVSFLETTASVGVGDVVASTDSRTFNAGFTVTVDLGETLTVASSATAGNVGFTTGVVNTTPTNKQINALNISTASGSNDAIETVDFAISQLSRVRGSIGAVQNRFLSAISSLQIASENLSAARSRILDADVAAETAELTRAQILTQAGVAVLAQANQVPAVALSLLGG